MRAITRTVSLIIGFFVTTISAPAFSITFSYDFTSGLNGDFTSFSERSFWNVDTDATGLRVSKGADDGSSFSATPAGSYSYAGVVSKFALQGDFSIALDFGWNSVTTPTFGGGDQSAGLYLLFSDTDPNDATVITTEQTLAQSQNYSHWSGAHSSNVLLPAIAANLGGLSVAPISGTLEIIRQGSALSFYQTNSALTQQLIGTISNSSFGGSVLIGIAGRQGQNVNSSDFSQIDPRGGVDVSFQALRVDAENVTGVPAPASIAIFCLGLAAFSHMRRKRTF